MKTTIAIIAGLAFGLAGVSPAFAWHLIPENTNFTGSGRTSATVNGITLKCAASLTGSVDNTGVGSITGGSFTGQLGCSSVQLTNLPWTATAATRFTVRITNVTFSTPIGDCGPGTLTVKLGQRGYFSWTNASLPGGCTISGHILTSPKLSIASGY